MREFVLKVLVITNLFPNHYEPRRGMYNLQLFTALSKFVDIMIVAPIPYYPGMSLFSGLANSGRVKDINKVEMINNLKVLHPRYLSIPKVGRSLYGYLFYFSIYKLIREIKRDFDFDIILSPWAYPDGFASFLIARKLDVPFFIHILGTDINDYTKYFLRRKMIVKALRASNKVIAMSKALREKVIGYGIPEEKVMVNYNGVNRDIFNDTNKEDARHELNLDSNKRHILFVGNLVPVKGLEYLIQAVSLLLNNEKIPTDLHIIGQGHLKAALEKLVKNKGLANNVNFLGEKNHEEISLYMKACTVLCLPSMNEGVPNVLLEAMSCGTPVVASRVGGIPEVVVSEKLGILTPPKDVKSLAMALSAALNKEWNYKEIRNYTEKFSWNDCADRLYQEIVKVIKK